MQQPTEQGSGIDGYIAQFPPEVQRLLQQMRHTIGEVAPMAAEAIKYGMPAFTYKGNLVYFAGYRHHIGFYPSVQPLIAFAEELKGYKQGKGSVQFPLDQPLPLDLIARMVRFRVTEQEAAAMARKARTTGRKH